MTSNTSTTSYCNSITNMDQLKQAAAALQLLQYLQGARSQIEQHHLPAQLAKLAPLLRMQHASHSTQLQPLQILSNSETSPSDVMAKLLMQVSNSSRQTSPRSLAQLASINEEKTNGRKCSQDLDDVEQCHSNLGSTSKSEQEIRDESHSQIRMSHGKRLSLSPEPAVSADLELNSPRSSVVSGSESDDENDWLDSVLNGDDVLEDETFSEDDSMKGNGASSAALSLKRYRSSVEFDDPQDYGIERKRMKSDTRKLPTDDSSNTLSKKDRIFDSMKTLQTLVPNEGSQDAASILDNAIEYVAFLKRQVKELTGEER